ncbi:MAG: orotidine-5'-phosphate decarboxylase [Chrysiogenetes bacterium]|nr:orotidine-5'-phosphate decarboxylase [Chrysiogenetes bacterium]
MSENNAAKKLIVALDTPLASEARELFHQLNHFGVRFKVGPELFMRAGPDWVGKMAKQGCEIFLDLKFHDIPNTVAAACRNAVHMGVWMCNVHALGGPDMMKAARAALDEESERENKTRPHLLAVTILTSHTDESLGQIGLGGNALENVVRLARLARESGCDGVVASALEAPTIRKELGEDFLIVTPGIRPSDASLDDQARVSTPAGALGSGASHLVVGRPIRNADSPAVATRMIVKEMSDALGR